MQVVTLYNLTDVLSHSLNTMSETIFSNSPIFQEFAKLKYTLNLKTSKSQNLTNAKISRPKVRDCTLFIGGTGLEIWHTGQQLFCEGKHTGQQLFLQNIYMGQGLF